MNRTMSMESINSILCRVYMYMATGLGVTAVVAYYVSANENIMQMLFSSSVPMIVIGIVELAIAFTLGAKAFDISKGTAMLLFSIFSVLNGLLLSSLFWIYATASIVSAFLSTAGMFGGMCMYGYFTNRDLSTLGAYGRMLVWGIIVVGIVNWFVGSDMVEFTLSIITVIVFLILAAYDTQKMIEMRDYVTDGLEIVLAVNMYLDFINIFINLLRIMGKRRR